jgi:hypothetical protein
MTDSGAPPSTPELQPLRSVPSTDFAPGLHDLDLSVLVLTYQGGKSPQPLSKTSPDRPNPLPSCALRSDDTEVD